MSSEIWKIDRDFCRCCHSRGVFTSLGEACTHIVPKQKYIDMLKDSLDVIISAIPGELSAATFKICDECASQLHAIVKFKKQVKICEDRFKDMYSRNLIELADTIDQPIIKVELIDDSEDDYKDFTDMDFDDDDDPILDIRKQVTKKVYAKNPKPKSKAKKPAKKAAKPKKTPKVEIEIDTENGVDADAEADADAGAEADAGTDVKTEDADKKGGVGKQVLRYKIVEDSSGKIYACVKCARRLKSREDVTHHYYYQHKACSICSADVPRHKLALHKESEHGIPAPSCGACGRKFNMNYQVLRHQKIYHMGERRYSCDICNMKFKIKAHLDSHAANHSSERPFKCEHCEKTFKRKSNLQIHVKIHLDDRRQVCRVCGEAFVQRASLKYHITKRHPETL